MRYQTDGPNLAVLAVMTLRRRVRVYRSSLPVGIVALVWALHPLVTETVVYVTQRTELMMALFYLLTIYASLRYWAAHEPAERTAWVVAATLASTLGMLSKEMMASVPAMVWLFERTFVAGTFRNRYRFNSPTLANNVNTSFEVGRVVTMLDLETGIGWQSFTGNLRVSMGYMFSAWYNVVRVNEYINAVQTNNYADPSDNFNGLISFDGLTSKIELLW